MRTGWSLLAVVGLALVVGCSANPDAECVAAGGVCFLASDPNGCGDNLEVGCSPGYSCCALTSINALDVVDGQVQNEGALPDTGVDGGDAALHEPDSATDALPGHDALDASDATSHDGHAPLDATTHDGAGG